MSNSVIGNIRSTIRELWSRKIEVNKSKDGLVYFNGENNLYPNEIERVVGNSPTASRAAKIMGKYIAGRGLRNNSQDIIVNTRKNYKLSNITALAGQEVAVFGGAYFHVGFGFDDDTTNGVRFKQKSLDILDYTKCRIAKEDDDNNAGKIYYKDFSIDFSFWNKTSNGVKWFYPYNPNQEVIKAQVEADHLLKGGSATDELIDKLKNYRGQVYYWNLTPRYKYALAPVDSVYNDADSENRISTYTNGEVRSGFLGKTAVITSGLDDKDIEQIDKDISTWLGAGADDTNSLWRLNIGRVDDIDKVVKILQVKPQYDEKTFQETKKDLRANILGAYNSIPEILVLSSNGALFGPSGETYEQAKLFYCEQTEDERWKLNETINYLGFDGEIDPIIEIKDDVLTVKEPETTPTV